MLANFFGKSKPVNFIVVILLFLGYFFAQAIQDYENTVTLGNYTLTKLQELGFFLLFFAVFNFIVTKNKLTFDNTYAFLILVLLTGVFPAVIGMGKTFYVNLIITLSLRKVYSLQSSNKIFQKLFDSGFWLGIAFIIEPFSCIFLLLVYIAVYVHRKVSIQSLLLPIMGFVVPVFLYFTYCLWNDRSTDFYQLFEWYTHYNFTFYEQPLLLWSLLIVGILTVLTLLIKSSHALTVNNTFRKSWIVISFNLLAALGLVVLLKEKDSTELLYLLLPTSIILANGVEMIRRKWISDLLFTAFVLTSVLLFIV